MRVWSKTTHIRYTGLKLMPLVAPLTPKFIAIFSVMKRILVRIPIFAFTFFHIAVINVIIHCEFVI